MSKSKQPNLARLIYDAYLHSDLLPIDPEQDCRDLATLLNKVTIDQIGDSLFKFMVVEIAEGGEGTRKGAVRVLRQARQDIEAVLRALGHREKDEVRQWYCPDCNRQVSCSYEHLAEVGTPICPNCDVEMRLL